MSQLPELPPIQDEPQVEAAVTPGLPPPPDLGWLKQQEQAGLIPPPPRPSDLDVPRILKPRKLAPATPGPFKQGSKSWKWDQKLGEHEWEDVLHAFAISGVPAEIAQHVNLDIEAVQHLLDHGVRRLDLPAIREAAVSHKEVTSRLKKMNALQAKSNASLVDLKDPDVQEAITDRVTQEAAVASTLLTGAARAMETQLKFIDAIHQKLQTGESAFDIPDQITPQFMKLVSDASNAMARVADRAVRLSKLVAGETEQTLELVIAQMVVMLNDEELMMAAKSGTLPPRFRGRAHEMDAVLNSNGTEAAKLIDAAQPADDAATDLDKE